MCLTMAVGAQSYKSDNIKLNDGSLLKITFVGHGSLILDYGSTTIYVDPAADITDYAGMPKGDVLLYTHQHGDHFDVPTAMTLSTDETEIIGTKAVIETLGKGQAIANGESATVAKTIKIEAVPAYNTTEGRSMFHPKGRDNGYVINVGGSRIYIAGDTEPIDEMKQLRTIDVAFLPVNQPYTMTIEQAIETVKMIQPKIFYPYHFSDTPVETLKERLSETAVEVRLRDLK